MPRNERFMTLETDSLQSFLQWGAAIGVAIGTGVAAFFGFRGRKAPDDDREQLREDAREQARIVDQARMDERERVKLATALSEERIRSEWREELKETRGKLYEVLAEYHNSQEVEFSRLGDKLDKLNEQFHDIKNRTTGVERDMETLKSRRAR